jgi:hypothetical protein
VSFIFVARGSPKGDEIHIPSLPLIEILVFRENE